MHGPEVWAKVAVCGLVRDGPLELQDLCDMFTTLLTSNNSRYASANSVGHVLDLLRLGVSVSLTRTPQGSNHVGSKRPSLVP